MTETKEDLKKEYETLDIKSKELSEEEINEIAGGRTIVYEECPNCRI